MFLVCPQDQFLIGTMVQITHNLNGARVSHTCDMRDVGGAKSE